MGNAYIYKDNMFEGEISNPTVKMLVRQLRETNSSADKIRARLYELQSDCSHVYYKLSGLSPFDPITWVCSECGHKTLK